MKNTSRRTFIKQTAAVAASSALPGFFIGKAGAAANTKLNIAHVGAGGIAKMAYGPSKGENTVALCDIDETKFDEHASNFPHLEKAARFKDFRVMLDKMGDQIDAVCINTPDHTHFAATMEAMQRGKHVFTQKPLTHNIWQARTLKKAKDKYGVTTVMGNQGHTYDGIRSLREWYDADVLGQVKEVHTWHKGPEYSSRYFSMPEKFPPDAMEVPAHIDWDLWVGPVVTELPYNELFHPLTWRGYYEFGSGILGDWFPHIGDGPVWILDLYNPVSAELLEQSDIPEGVAAESSVVKWEFEKRGSKEPCTLYWHNGGKKPEAPTDWGWGNIPNAGSFFIGDQKTAYLDQRSNNPRLSSKQDMIDFKESGFPEEKYARIKADGPVGEWIAAIKGEGPEPGSNFDYASPFTETHLLGVLAMRFGGKVEWDADAMKITNRPELNAFVKEPVLKGWEYGDNLWS
ncbi:MAG: Gfo/Idh/MocA family oxidoreductase [Verrucomicrobiota bacterium]